VEISEDVRGLSVWRARDLVLCGTIELDLDFSGPLGAETNGLSSELIHNFPFYCEVSLPLA
jgi:hypothetical protein